MNYKEDVLIVDIETILGCFLLSAYNPITKEYTDFLINGYQNDLYKLIKWCEANKDKYIVTYNGLSFDGQVIEFIIREYEKWSDLSALDICRKISDFATETINNSNYGGFPTYKELYFKQIDVFKIQHFDNKNRRVGLKRLEYEMDMENIEEMKVSPDKEHFTEQEVAELIFYCHNDVYATYLNYLYIIGEVDNSLYKGNNQIQIREALSETFGFDCLNWSNSKYGDEIIKTLYSKESGVDYRKLPKKGTFRKKIKLIDCISSKISFQTKELNDFLLSLKNKEFSQNDEFSEEVKFKGQIYDFKKGGLHNRVENKQYLSDNQYVIIDCDVTAYYVATTLNNKLAPAHLNKEAFCKSYEWIYTQRSELKPKAKTDNKIKGIVSGYKEAGVSVYGKSGDKTNWLYDPKMMLTICITGELSILMLIESQELAGNSCIMANTDGATFYVKRENVDKFYEICKNWVNLTDYQLEYFEFEWLKFLSVNHYIGKKSDGEIKRKGDFLIESELHKNKSFRVIPLALSAYFIDGIQPEEFINKFDNIYHFCARSSAGQTYYHEGYQGNTVLSNLPKLIRYYVAKEGIKIKKMVRDDAETNANDAYLNPADELKYMCNNLPEESHNFHLNNVNRDWYIKQVREIIFRIEKGKKPKKPKIPTTGMGSLF